MFIVSLIALAKTMAVTFATFLLMLLFFNDTLDVFDRGETVFLYIFLGFFFYSLGVIVHVFAILLPTYYIDRNKYETLPAVELFTRHAPFVALIATFFCGMAALIGGKDGLAEGMMQCNLFNVYVMAFAGLLFFEFEVKNAMEKNMVRFVPPEITVDSPAE